jgi:hypothetical protein
MGYLGAKYTMFSGPVLPYPRAEEAPAGLILSRKTYILKYTMHLKVYRVV